MKKLIYIRPRISPNLMDKEVNFFGVDLSFHSYMYLPLSFKRLYYRLQMLTKTKMQITSLKSVCRWIVQFIHFSMYKYLQKKLDAKKQETGFIASFLFAAYMKEQKEFNFGFPSIYQFNEHQQYFPGRKISVITSRNSQHWFFPTNPDATTKQSQNRFYIVNQYS